MPREREGEREKGYDGRNSSQWTKVQRRKNGGRSMVATRTCFVDSLPLDIQVQELVQIFRPYGSITNVFIPKQLRPNRRFHYAFVRFASSSSLPLAIKEEHGRPFGESSIRIFRAKHDSILPNTTQKPPYNTEQPYVRQPKLPPSTKTHRNSKP